MKAPGIVIACGGTGGHLFPGLAVAAHLVDEGCTVTAIISPKEVDQRAVRNANHVRIATLPAVGLSGKQVIPFLRGFLRSYRDASAMFRQDRPAAALGMGGFTSAAPILAARRAGARTFLHESNSIPGRANRWLARVADEVFVGFESAAKRLRARCVTVTGTPVRSGFRLRNAESCRKEMGLDPARPVILVTGGSQGATGLNHLVTQSLPKFAKIVPQWQWVHLSGTHDFESVSASYAAAGVSAQVHAYFSEMEIALGAASACISRSGASSLAELAAVRLPSLLVPFPAAVDDHQYFNARAYADSGAALLLDQTSASTDELLALRVLVEEPATRTRMQKALAKWDAPDAAARIAQTILTGAGIRTVPKSDANGPTNSQSGNPAAYKSLLNPDPAADSPEVLA
jgi:UDP-N-acetylglucosamine--N-acetylmuramyl-(pentapeptide) pyrophosphoryl-undecaprenol N-acetylglucosamine transferase